jgi:hypothetical protein
MTEPATGWVCPTCKRGVRPDEKTCDHGAMGLMPLPDLLGDPRKLLTVVPATMPMCGCPIGAACSNVACPYMAKTMSVPFTPICADPRMSRGAGPC